MKKTLKLWLALALALVTGVQAWAQEEEPKVWDRSYSFSFSYWGNSDDATTAVTNAEELFGSLSDIKDVTSLKYIYRVGYNTAGNYFSSRLGNASHSGELAFTLAKSVKAKSIRVQAKQYSNTENKITVNGKEFELTPNWAYYTVNLVDEKNPDGQDISAISIVSTKRAYIRGIYVYYTTSELSPVSRSYYPEDGADLGEYVENIVKTEAENGYILSSLRLNLNNGGKYTVTKSIVVGGELRLYGNGATIDASELNAPLFTLSETPAVVANEWGAYPINQVYFNNVTVNELKQDLVKSLGNYLVNYLQVYSSVINYSKDKIEKISVFNFSGGGHGNVRQLTISNSTIFAPDGAKWQNGGLFSSQSGKDIRELDKKIDADGKLTATQIFNITNSTLYNIAYSKTVNSLRKNSQDYLYFNVNNSIIANCGKSKQFLRGLNAGQEGQRFEDKNGTKIQNWNVYDNTFMFDGQIIEEQTVGTKNISGADEKKAENATNVRNCQEQPAVFADAANGNLTLGDCIQKLLWLGDARWIDTKVYTNQQYQVKNGENPHGWLNSIQVKYLGNSNWNDWAYEGATVIANLGCDYNYAIKDVTVVPEGDWGNAKAPRRALGFLQEGQAVKLIDNQWAFVMPRANVSLNVTYTTIIGNLWISYDEIKPIPANFEGEVKPNFVIQDNVNPITDKNGKNPGDAGYIYTYKTLKEGVDYTIEFKNNTKPGIATYTITGIGDYSGTVEGSFEILLEVSASDESDLLVRITDEEKKECEIIQVTPEDGEKAFTVPAEVDGYKVVRIDAEALKNADALTDVYIPALEAGQSIYFAENALLPKGFTHPSNMFNVHVEDVTMLDDYANMPGLKPFAKYSRLMAEVTIGESAYATFSTGIPVQFEENAQVSIVKAHSATQVTKQVVKGNKVPKNTGVLLFGKPGKYTVYAINENTLFTSADYDGNLLEAVTAPTAFPLNDDDAAANSYFVLKNGAFYAIADNTDSMVPACKAILKVAKGEAAAAAPMLEIFTGELTGISAVKADLKNAEIFDLNGRKVSNAQKGMFIVNGKKVVIK